MTTRTAGLKKVSIQKSKQVCSKPISTQFWALDDVKDRWDDIEMRSWMIVDGVKKRVPSRQARRILAS
ncbi:DUF2848 family protein [Peribacillus frigoritolerans]|nr:DUF2848 family protein [Peribacillus frigoritolerans]